MVGAEMLTNGSEEYQMTPGDWEGGTEQKVTQSCLRVLYWLCFLSLSLFISLYIYERVIAGVKQTSPTAHQKEFNQCFLINKHTHIAHEWHRGKKNNNSLTSINNSTT